MSLIRVYDEKEIEYRKLQFFCDVCNNELINWGAHKYVFIRECYFDLGQDWKYTALITEDFAKYSTWQSVCPRDYEAIVSSDSFSEIEAWAYDYAEALMREEVGVHLSF